MYCFIRSLLSAGFNLRTFFFPSFFLSFILVFKWGANLSLPIVDLGTRTYATTPQWFIDSGLLSRSHDNRLFATPTKRIFIRMIVPMTPPIVASSHQPSFPSPRRCYVLCTKSKGDHYRSVGKGWPPRYIRLAFNAARKVLVIKYKALFGDRPPFPSQGKQLKVLTDTTLIAGLHKEDE